MKIIYQNKLYQPIGDSWQGLFIIEGGPSGKVTLVKFDDPSLIVDPTDDEIKGLDNLPEFEQE